MLSCSFSNTSCHTILDQRIRLSGVLTTGGLKDMVVHRTRLAHLDGDASDEGFTKLQWIRRLAEPLFMHAYRTLRAYPRHCIESTCDQTTFCRGASDPNSHLPLVRPTTVCILSMHHGQLFKAYASRVTGKQKLPECFFSRCDSTLCPSNAIIVYFPSKLGSAFILGMF